MLKKFFNLEFGLQMIIICFSIMLGNQLVEFLLNLSINETGHEKLIWSIVSLLCLSLEVSIMILGFYVIIKKFKK